MPTSVTSSAAIPAGDEACQIAREGQRPYDVALSSWYAGFIHSHRGDVHSALPLLKEALGLCTSNRLQFLYPVVSTSLGFAFAQAGAFPEANGLLSKALAMAQGAKFHYAETWSSIYLGYAKMWAGNRGRCAGALHKSTGIGSELWIPGCGGGCASAGRRSWQLCRSDHDEMRGCLQQFARDCIRARHAAGQKFGRSWRFQRCIKKQANYAARKHCITRPLECELQSASYRKGVWKPFASAVRPGQLNRNMLWAAHEYRRRSLWPRNKLHIQHAIEKLFKKYSHLNLCEVLAEAHMRAITEGETLARRFMNMEAVRLKGIRPHPGLPKGSRA